MDIQAYMEEGLENIRRRVGLYYLKNSRGRRFLASFFPALKKSSRLRAQYESSGPHVPIFLICSITSRCNLHCAGCYARAGGLCADSPESAAQLSAEQWRQVFIQARDIGVAFIMLAGGEPLLRREVLEAAADIPELVFPIFTNATLLDQAYLELFDRCRHLLPVLSIEGDGAATDARRGQGVAERVEAAISGLRRRGILFAASVTVTRDNMRRVASAGQAAYWRAQGCGVLFLVEYVPVEPGTEALALGPQEAEWLERQVAQLREQQPDMCIFSFPGDEKYSEGCLAAGRGFFHINPWGGAEPCPFAPYSRLNVTEHSLLEVLESRYFRQVREIEAADTLHDGGCTLFRHQGELQRLLQNN